MPFCILNEEVDYRFPADVTASVPYVNAGKDGDYNGQFHNSFENVYTTAPISQLNKERLMFLPLVVQATPEVKVCITETDLNNYPGPVSDKCERFQLVERHTGSLSQDHETRRTQ